MSLTERYHQCIAQGLILEDAEQAKVITALQHVADALQQKYFFWQRKKIVTGVYIWGKVGRGKTYLMDLFFESLPFNEKRRIHFHRFMLEIHQALHELKSRADPLIFIAKQIAKETRVLCFDEFVVEDIADAMVLGNFFKALLAQGVTLIATSNSAPDQLYWNGLQRELFLPCIQLIEEHATVFHLTHKSDYRRQYLLHKGAYFTPLNQQADNNMQQALTVHAREPIEKHSDIIIDGRSIKAIVQAASVVWFDFAAICNIPRSKRDYLLLVERYDVFLISHVPQLKARQDDVVCNFIALVDVLYDARKKLILSAEVPIDYLYLQGRFTFEFQRTMSRLVEMQSLAYTQCS